MTTQQKIQTTDLNTDALYNDLSSIRKVNPLVHNVTNHVVMELTANVLLAAGASPIMAHAPEEMEELLSIVNALVINIGTLDNAWIESMHIAVQAAKINNVPVVLDPVGAGATTLRTTTAKALLDLGATTVLRGNAAEVMALAGVSIQSKGVDSQYLSEVAHNAMVMLNEQYGCVVVVSGAEDLIATKDQCIKISNGDPMMSKVTGMGCSATALIGAYCAVNDNAFTAAAHAMATMGIAGEIAAKTANGPATLRNNFIDVLYELTKETIETKLKKPLQT